MLRLERSVMISTVPIAEDGLEGGSVRRNTSTCAESERATGWPEPRYRRSESSLPPSTGVRFFRATQSIPSSQVASRCQDWTWVHHARSPANVRARRTRACAGFARENGMYSASPNIRPSVSSPSSNSRTTGLPSPSAYTASCLTHSDTAPEVSPVIRATTTLERAMRVRTFSDTELGRGTSPSSTSNCKARASSRRSLTSPSVSGR